MDPITGAINISRPLDISESQEYTLILVASDGKWEARASLKIYVHEAEERDPRFNQNTYKFSVLENVAGAVVGQVIHTEFSFIFFFSNVCSRQLVSI